MKFFILLFIVFPGVLGYAQQDTFEFDLFTIRLDGNKMIVTGNEGSLVDSVAFSNPSGFAVDLDADSVNEFLVIDYVTTNEQVSYTAYLYNLLDTYYLVDSLPSGFTEPYFTFDEEIGEPVIITGNPDFLKYNTSDFKFLPVNCYSYNNGELFLVNDEVYDIFIAENDDILKFIEEYSGSNGKDCESSQEILAAVAAVYANYVNAGEQTLARHLISNYYYCDDKESFISEMNMLLNKERYNETQLE